MLCLCVCVCLCIPCLGVTLKRAMACGPSCMLGPLALLRLDLALGAALSSSDELSSSYTPAKSVVFTSLTHQSYRLCSYTSTQDLIQHLSGMYVWPVFALRQCMSMRLAIFVWPYIMANTLAVSPRRFLSPTSAPCRSHAPVKYSQDATFTWPENLNLGCKYAGTYKHTLTQSSRYWTMISWPDAAASISGLNPNTGSLKEKGKGQRSCSTSCFRCLFPCVTYLILAFALLSKRNLTICWCPVLVLCRRAVHPRPSLRSSSAPCFTKRKSYNQSEA